APGVHTPAFRPLRDRLGSVDFGKMREVMAEIARSGKKWRPAGFITAIAGNAPGVGGRARDPLAGFIVEQKMEDPEFVGAVLALAKAGADDDACHRLLIEHPARCDIGNRCAVLASDLSQDIEKSLQHAPAADPIDEALVLHGAPVADLARLGL